MEGVWIYVLALEGDKVYVGQTSDPDARLAKHFSGRGALWTIIHPPQYVIEQRPARGPLDEGNTVREYMLKHGVDNVRGGIYCQEDLPKEVRRYLKLEIWAAAAPSGFICYRCGRATHSVYDCEEDADADGEPISGACDSAAKAIAPAMLAEPNTAIRVKVMPAGNDVAGPAVLDI